MGTPYSLTLPQVDTINLSLSKALAVAQVIADCGREQRNPGEDEPTPASLFMVMQVIVDELEKIGEVMKEIRRG